MKNLNLKGDLVERRDWLESMAETVLENASYNHRMTDEEIEEERRTFADLSIRIENLKAELAELTLQYKEKIRPLESKAKDCLFLIRTQNLSINGTLYELIDYSEGRIGTYDVNGHLISERSFDRKKGISIGLFSGASGLPYVENELDDVNENEKDSIAI